jgi:hypothetical protein
MATAEKPAEGQIVRSSGSAIATRSAKLVSRGLQDLSKLSNWSRIPYHGGKVSKVAVSASGVVCSITAEQRKTPPRVVIHDLLNPISEIALAVPGETPALARHLPAAFAWSRTGRYLAGVWSAWEPSIHLFDLESKEFIGAFGKFERPPAHLAWSPNSLHVAAASSGGRNASLRVWLAGTGGERIDDAPIAHNGIPNWLERQTYEAEFGEEGAFHGYGRTEFSPDGWRLANVVEIQGEWADDAILLAAVPTLRLLKSFQAQGHISDLAWLAGGGDIVYCAGSQAYRLHLDEMRVEALPFGAELCAAHPKLPLIACHASWRKDSAHGQLFIANIETGERYDVHDADGIVELRWSEDGKRAYGVAKDGNAYLYAPEEIPE